MDTADQLRREFSRYEKLLRLLANLEKLKQKGEIDASQYAHLKNDYEKRRDESVSAMKQTRAELKKDRASLTDRIGELDSRIADIQTRAKTGELDTDDIEIQVAPFESERTALNESLSGVNRSLAARSSSDLGGFIDPDGLPGERGSVEEIPGPELFAPTIPGITFGAETSILDLRQPESVNQHSLRVSEPVSGRERPAGRFLEFVRGLILIWIALFILCITATVLSALSSVIR